MDSSSVLIVGGGITGCAAAWELARSGATVRVLEKRDLASMGSGRTLAGVRQSGRHPAEMPLAMAAVRRWETLHDELDADLEYRQDGNLRLAEDAADAAFIQKMAETQRSLGLDIRYLDGNDEVRGVAPALSETISGAAFTPSDGHANPIATVRAYATAAERAGAQFESGVTVSALAHDGDRVTGVETDRGTYQAEQVVVAAGVETPNILKSAGLEFAISLAMVPVVQTVPINPLFKQVLGTAKAHFAARQEVDGRVRFSSGGRPIDVSTEGLTRDIMQPGCGRTAETLSRAVAIIPVLAEAPISQIWGGLVDLTADGIPVIDRVTELEGLTVAAGFCGHGFCLGPVSGEIIRDLVLGRTSRFDLEPFRWNRSVAHENADSPELLG